MAVVTSPTPVEKEARSKIERQQLAIRGKRENYISCDTVRYIDGKRSWLRVGNRGRQQNDIREEC